jgi:hypothetical protein
LLFLFSVADFFSRTKSFIDIDNGLNCKLVRLRKDTLVIFIRNPYDIFEQFLRTAVALIKNRSSGPKIFLLSNLGKRR